jgi:hypothetical protein
MLLQGCRLQLVNKLLNYRIITSYWNNLIVGSINNLEVSCRQAVGNLASSWYEQAVRTYPDNKSHNRLDIDSIKDKAISFETWGMSSLYCTSRKSIKN